MSIQNLYPKARPQTIYNVINGRPELPAASTFSRASIGTYVDANGIIKTAAVDEPRFNYDVETGMGMVLELLLEKERTNSFTNSNFTQDTPTAVPTDWSGYNPAAFLTSQTLSPDGVNFGLFHGAINTNGGGLRKDLTGLTAGGTYRISYYVKGLTTDELTYFTNNNGRGTTTGTDNGANNYAWFAATKASFTCISLNGTGASGKSQVTLTTDWQRFDGVVTADSAGSARIIIRNDVGDEGGTWMAWGAQLEGGGSSPTSYIPTTTSTVTREADVFSLTSSSNVDGGFSLLLDSNSTTDDYFYKIKAGGITIAELSNANGTLDWVINGTSAATSVPPQYPQISAIQPGRVRTISSFGAADGTTQQNYLYTDGLSFPTDAIVASGADEIEFGPGQTLRAVYLWNGQLSDTEAVSVIKGQYNIVPDEPIKADSYSFVYNTDPTDVGEASITLPYIVPTVSMRVYWGDGTSSAYEQGVTPSHTYPYPGQYRIQIEADDGFDAVRLGDVTNSITRVDQWAPQHRVDAAGDGFTGSDLYKVLATQAGCPLIPPFKYTDLTDLNQAFYNCQKAAVNNWDWIPTNLQSVTNLDRAFSSVSRLTMSTPERGTFPQLQTGTALTSVAECFRFNTFTQFDQGNSGLPFSNTQNVTDWSGCFRDSTSLTTIGSLVTSAATTLSSTFNGCSNLAAMPFIATNNVTDFSNAWDGCSALTAFPNLNFDSATKLDGAWQGTGLTAFPVFDFPLVTRVNSAWRTCFSLVSFPANITLPICTSFASAWRGCNLFTSFPLLNVSSGTDFNSTWRGCASLTSFPKLNVSSAIGFGNAWNGCTDLANFPDDNSQDMFNTTGVLSSNAFDEAFSGCDLTAQSIENILVSLDTNGQSNIELGIDGGTNAGQSTWTAAANTAYTNLINKGWTITFNP
jgi:hypothetical protein